MPGARRIALVAPLEPYVGPELATLVFGLVERGWDAHLVLETPTPREKTRITAIDSVAKAGRLHLSKPVQGRPRRGSSAARLRSLDPQLVHFLSAEHGLGLSSIAPGATSKLVATVSAADANVAGLEIRDYYLPLWQRADLLHFPDDAVLSRAARRGLPPDKPRAVIPPLVDPGSYHPNGRQPDATRSLRVVCAGALEWRGGYEHGLHALALAVERGVACQCRVVGDGPHQTALVFARQQLGLDEIVTFEPASPQALNEHLAWAEVFLAPTVVDGLPDRLIEAAAMELCLVLADPGPLGELEPGEPVAITVPRRDPDALADALARVAADPARRARMGSAARAWALEHFPVDEHLDRMDDLYRQTLAESA
jgi:colanic acid/amylovoran biosynthesis glycosyltransferase